MKKTKWFADVEPVHVGVYQRRYEFGIYFAHFDGEDWGLAGESVNEANLWGGSTLKTSGGLPWRGLVAQGGGA